MSRNVFRLIQPGFSEVRAGYNRLQFETLLMYSVAMTDDAQLLDDQG